MIGKDTSCKDEPIESKSDHINTKVEFRAKKFMRLNEQKNLW